MIVLRVGNVFTELVSGKMKAIRPALRVKDPRCHFDPRYKFGGWDGYVSFYDVRNSRFPSGMLDRVEKRLQKRNIAYRIIHPENRKPLSLEGIDAKMLFGADLRDKQVEAVRRAVQRERARFGLATNFGKTYWTAAVSKHVLEVGHLKSLILVPTTNLLLQTSSEVQKLAGVTVGQIGASRRTIGPVTVATAQTIIKGCPTYIEKLHEKARKKGKKCRLRFDPKLHKFLKTIGCLIIDEGHHASADTWQHIMQTCPARLRFAISGTISTKNDLRDALIAAYTGPVVMRVTNKELIDAGHSAKPYVWVVTDSAVHAKSHTAPKYVKTKKRNPVTGKVKIVKTKMDPLKRAKYEQDAMLADSRYNDAIVRIAKAVNNGGLKPLILTTSIKHVHLLEEMLKKMKMRPHVIWGKIPPQERLDRVARFSKDPRGVLIGSTVFDEGMNAPSIGAMILTAGGKALRPTMQRIGRSVRRKTHGLNLVSIFDMGAYNGEYIGRHTLDRIAIYSSEGFVIKDLGNIEEFEKKARGGWLGLLGKEGFAREQARQKLYENPPSGKSKKLISGPRSSSLTRSVKPQKRSTTR